MARLPFDVTPAFFKEVNDETTLSFLSDNKERFKVEEIVKLRIEIKNLKTVFCKIFEFNAETFYRKNQRAFDTSIDLDGLESLFTRKLDLSENPSNYKERMTLEFPELNDRVGLFIIEFVGDGHSARAIIKKGSMSLIHRSTEAGHMLYILDESKQICKGGDKDNSKTGVWFDNKFYEADPSQGNIFLPYST
jgi:hypothetical protein